MAGTPSSSATRARSDSSKSISPRIARSVTAATSASQPAWAAIISMTSPWMRVESTSMTMSRIERRSRLAGCTAMSMPWEAASAASSGRSTSGSTPEMARSIAVTG